MNIMHKPETFAASFPELSLDSEVTTEANLVNFTLEVKNTIIPIYVSGVIEASEKEDCYGYNATLDPQNEVDVYFNYLEIDYQSLAKVEDFSEFEVFEGMKFKLTQAQVQQLNEWLKEAAWESRVKEIENLTYED